MSKEDERTIQKEKMIEIKRQKSEEERKRSIQKFEEERENERKKIEKEEENKRKKQNIWGN